VRKLVTIHCVADDAIAALVKAAGIKAE